MVLQDKRLAVAIPDTVLEERDTLREKTVKLGTIARACAIYGVDVIEVFRDTAGRGEGKLVKKILEYLETPQYLRRRLYSLDESLKFAGLLPPLRIPSHKPRVPFDGIRVGDVREGVVNNDGTVDVGLERAARLKPRLEPNSRVTVRIVSKNPFTAEIVGREAVGQYWGYRVESRSLEEVLGDGRFELKIATSRYGNAIRSVVQRLREEVKKAGSIMLIFGSPTRGLYEIVGPGLPRRVDFVVNLFVEQHVETVRTEEAIFAGLNLVNNLLL
jgi:predicted SPOUT superfamily RNA methylase MTH1